ncbi:lymphocyte-specific protein 1 isoform X14 [Oryctolagus cuniculus]|uniref:lymphocyte-specific protein 1 isoform X14 n=1 Tax=Oryctolagus cuniculus TaxID=9986 RepID=UPI003879C50C
MAEPRAGASTVACQGACQALRREHGQARQSSSAEGATGSPGVLSVAPPRPVALALGAGTRRSGVWGEEQQCWAALTCDPGPRPGQADLSRRGQRSRGPRRGGCHGAHHERLTTQWGAEDEEETAREPLQQLQAQDHRAAGQAPEQEIPPGLKPLQAPEPDEDEGFSDWSQRPEQRQQSWGSSDSGDPAQGESPEREQESRPLQDGGEVNQAKDHLEGLCLSQQGPGPGDTRPCNAGVAEADGAELVDRTESLSRSVEKSSPKKAQPTLPVARIDERLEQYTQAVETAGRTPRLARQTSIELPSMAVASTKSRWETGEVQAQSAAKATSCKDIVAGDMSKRSFWEQKEGSKTSSTLKSTPSGKRYKFVATGHGKYEKVLVDEGAAP